MARIGIDGTAISRNGKGVCRYQKNIIRSLSQLKSGHEYYVFTNQRYGFGSLVENKNWHFISVPVWKALVWEQIGIPNWMKRLRLDLFHTTTDRLPYLGKGKFLLQLFEIPDHRIRLARNGSSYSLYQRVADLSDLGIFPHTLMRASRILVSSDNTGRELMKKYGVSFKKIKTVPLSHEDVFKPNRSPDALKIIRIKFGAPKGYILHFSTGDQRENTQVVIAAFKQARKVMDPDIKLLVIGYSKEGEDCSVIYKPYLDDTELIEAYQGALLYVDPSLYEGFALQVLEAMACGIPVIASNRTAILELVFDAGILIDPMDCKVISQSIIRILSDRDLWKGMREKGLRRAEQFSWEKTATATLSVYEEVLSGN